MGRLNIILKRDFRELRKSNASLIVIIVFAAVTIAAALTCRGHNILDNSPLISAASYKRKNHTFK
ncbi:MAG: hypothetical protein U9O59_04130 [Actinomycetota bacterium]|nr:hypothetical protein [Actinomycetota bacterium]